MLLPLLTLVGAVLADCECGYLTNTGETWQSKIVTDFSAATNASNGFNANWSITEKLQGDITNSTPYQIDYTSDNVLFPPSAAAGTVRLQASAYTESPGGAVASGQIGTIREDILYGSFRATLSVHGGAGACNGFFSYADDTNENDVEILTKDVDRDVVHFTNQAEDDPDSVEMTLPNHGLTTSPQTYRFDWTSAGVKYYVNDHFMTNVTRNPSALASRILFNTWSNGGSWTEGPPKTKAYMEISKIAMYFNSSAPSTCIKGGSVCRVDSGSVSGSGGHAVSTGTSSGALSQTNASSSAPQAKFYESYSVAIMALFAFASASYCL